MTDIEAQFERLIREEINRRRLLRRGAAGALGMSALTTARPAAMASRLTLPKASVVLGLISTSALAMAVDRSWPDKWPRKRVPSGN